MDQSYMNQFTDSAIEAGFTRKQAEFMEVWLSKYAHHHNMHEIIGLERSISTILHYYTRRRTLWGIT
jgi:hypothetical protein